MSLAKRMWVGGFLALALSSAAFASEDCPTISADPEASNIAGYPGGQPGRRKQDYMFIASILSIDAVCESTKDDKIIANITVTYAVEAGSLYPGYANVKLSAVAHDGATETGRATSAHKSNPGTGGKAVTVTDVIQGMVVGDEKAVDDGKIAVTVGFVQ